MIEMANGTVVCRANIVLLERERDEARDEAAVFKRTMDKRDEQIENLREQVRVLRKCLHRVDATLHEHGLDLDRRIREGIGIALHATEPKP